MQLWLIIKVDNKACFAWGCNQWYHTLLICKSIIQCIFLESLHQNGHPYQIDLVKKHKSILFTQRMIMIHERTQLWPVVSHLSDCCPICLGLSQIYHKWACGIWGFFSFTWGFWCSELRPPPCNSYIHSCRLFTCNTWIVYYGFIDS